MPNSSFLPVVTSVERSMPFYISTIGISEYERHICRPEGMGDYQILFPSSGRGTVWLNSRSYRLEKGDLLLMTPHTPHHYEAASDRWTTHWITFSGTSVQNLLPSESGIFKIDYDKCDSLFRDILLNKNDNWLENSTVLLYRLLVWCRLSVFNLSGSSINQSKQRLLPVTDYMNEHYGQPISLGVLSSLLEVSDGQLCRLFKTGYHVRPMEYLNLLRLQKSKELMIQKPSLMISQISRRVGFDSPSYFCKLFRQYEGITPMDFKRTF